VRWSGDAVADGLGGPRRAAGPRREELVRIATSADNHDHLVNPEDLIGVAISRQQPGSEVKGSKDPGRRSRTIRQSEGMPTRFPCPEGDSTEPHDRRSGPVAESSRLRGTVRGSGARP
jgi:hypothetical protein